MISDELKISAGVRSEDGTQEINTYDLFAGKDNTIDKTIDESYTTKPYIDISTYRIRNLQVRLGFLGYC